MSLKLIRSVAQLENNDNFHISRLLLLIRATDKINQKTIEGITKLAKLDFLLRYPNCLERALRALGKNPEAVRIESYERTTIESKMVRFKYGPWDSRYRRWIGLLIARDLVTTFVRGRTVHIGLTDNGRKISERIASEKDFEVISQRCEVITTVVGNYSATRIKDFVYQVFPELTSMEWGEDIAL